MSNKHYSVVSPEYSTGGYSGGYEPPEYGCASAEVIAPNKHRARVLAVRSWRHSDYAVEHPEEVEQSYGDMDYCDGGSVHPFKGLVVTESPPCSQHGYNFEECEFGICIPHQCEICETYIEPIGTEKDYSGNHLGEGTYAHELCLLPEEEHFARVFGEGYFA